MNSISRRNFFRLAGASSLSLVSPAINQARIFSDLEAKAGTLSSHDPWVELSLENLTWNLNQVKTLAKVPVMAVIKVNGYGHGLVEVGKHLEACEIDFLMVGKLPEALELRRAGVKSPILNFGSFTPEETSLIIENNVSQSVFHDGVMSLNQTAGKFGKTARVHIHVDTGMGRMGIPYQEALPFIKKVSALKNLRIEGISTTLTEDDEFDREQVERLLSLCQGAEAKGISVGLKHAASSDGILDLPSSHLDMVRPGIALYGYYPSEKTQKEDRLSLRPVLQLKSRVVAVKPLQPGDTLSYHRVYTARQKGKIAVIPVGYSDGYPPAAVNKASVLVNGKRYALVAAVTANHAIALLENRDKVAVGDEVVLIGTQGRERISAVEIAGWAGVSVYRILIGLNPLLPRKTL